MGSHLWLLINAANVVVSTHPLTYLLTYLLPPLRSPLGRFVVEYSGMDFSWLPDLHRPPYAPETGGTLDYGLTFRNIYSHHFWTVIVFNILRDWIQLATLFGYRLDTFELGLVTGFPLLRPQWMEPRRPVTRFFRLRSGCLLQGKPYPMLDQGNVAKLIIIPLP
jgi:hypothetical protein